MAQLERMIMEMRREMQSMRRGDRDDGPAPERRDREGRPSPPDAPLPPLFDRGRGEGLPPTPPLPDRPDRPGRPDREGDERDRRDRDGDR